MGIQVLPPDVNESIGYFAAVGTDIRFGMGRCATSASTSSTPSG
jgi:DNA polymerase III alpha subunit